MTKMIMTSMSKFIFISIFAVLIFQSSLAQNSDFDLLSSNITGIHFSNTIHENIATKENLFDYDYFYNGAGVGILDVNNDGLQDIFFAANQESNKIYLNKGNFKFKDITATALPDSVSNWSMGVSIVDINGDGYQDIYVCQGGPFAEDKRKNLLFVNNGDNTFNEAAENYGLADKGLSTQAVFFDFDRDGDLDCFVMNESIIYGLDPVTFARLNLERKRELYISFSHMYINEGGVYIDKTKELGLSKPTFGLGIKVSDFNEDGWKDLYISNDYYLPDMMLINQKGKGFSDQIEDYLKQMSFYGMGLDIADINNDGMNDIFVLDMASGDHYRAKTLMRSMDVDNFRLLVDGLEYPHQYMFNSMQLSRTKESYSNISQLAGVSSTDWSWSALIEDFDFDGLKDIHVTNGYRRYALDNDFQAKIREAKKEYNNEVPLEIKQELYNMMPTEKLQNVFYKNSNGLKFNNWDIGTDNNPPSYSNGAAIADLDNDGDQDLVVNNMDEKAFIYKNLSADNEINNFITIKTDPSSSLDIESIQIENDNETLRYDLSTVRGYLSSSEPTAFIGLGNREQVDEIHVHWENGEVTTLKDLAINKVHYVKYNISESKLISVSKQESTYFDEIVPNSIGLDYIHIENEYDDFQNEILLPFKQSTLGPFVTSADINNDKLDDLIFSNAVGQPMKIYTQTNTGFEDVSDTVTIDNNFQETGEIFTSDIDNNGYLDLLVPASGNEESDETRFYQSRIFMRNSTGTFKTLELPLTSGSSSKLISIDYDNDGDEDVIECKRHVAQHYPLHAPSHLYQNENMNFSSVTEEVFPDLTDIGIINDILVTDFNNDGWKDVIVVGEWTNIRFYKNENGYFINVNKEYNIPDLKGMWFSIDAIDLNNDNRNDYIVGNLGLNSKYKASEDKPLKVYGHDFDNNGTWDLVLSKIYKEEYVPLRGLECSSSQMPFIQDKFGTYDLFAKATIDEVYGTSLDSAYYRYINSLESIALISNTEGGFDKIKLPIEAQIAPILDIEVLDVNSDGAEDIILSGNIYDTEVETPRLDGGHSLILLNDMNGKFTVVKDESAGLNLNGNIKSTAKLFHKGGNCHVLIATQNNGSVKTFIKE